MCNSQFKHETSFAIKMTIQQYIFLLFYKTITIFKPGARLVYLKSLLCGCMCVCVCVCVCVDVCVSAPQAMNNYSRETKSE